MPADTQSGDAAPASRRRLGSPARRLGRRGRAGRLLRRSLGDGTALVRPSRPEDDHREPPRVLRGPRPLDPGPGRPVRHRPDRPLRRRGHGEDRILRLPLVRLRDDRTDRGGLVVRHQSADARVVPGRRRHSSRSRPSWPGKHDPQAAANGTDPRDRARVPRRFGRGRGPRRARSARTHPRSIQRSSNSPTIETFGRTSRPPISSGCSRNSRPGYGKPGNSHSAGPLSRASAI